jgi:GTPase SAR1 family protein
MERLEIAQDMDLPPTAKSAKIPVLKRIKILSMGDTKTGKSCLIKRFCEGQFLTDYVPTIGIDYGVKGFQTRLEEGGECFV